MTQRPKTMISVADLCTRLRQHFATGMAYAACPKTTAVHDLFEAMKGTCGKVNIGFHTWPTAAEALEKLLAFIPNGFAKDVASRFAQGIKLLREAAKEIFTGLDQTLKPATPL